MYKYRYDLHIHTCLSPCGDEDMTPNNIINMAVLKGRNVIAICDHNTCGNAEAVQAAARANELELVVIPGMEITTSEDIHVLVYFPNYIAAAHFEKELLRPSRIPIKNKPSIFGRQLYMNAFDEVIGEEENLLINATAISISELPGLVMPYGGLLVPAHIDKESNGMLAILGAFPDDTEFPVVEIKDKSLIDKIRSEHSQKEVNVITNSDAHFLWDISEGNESGDNILLSEKTLKSPEDFITALRMVRGFGSY